MLGRAILKHPAPRLCDIVLQEEEMNTARIDFVDARLSRQHGLHQGLPVEIPLAGRTYESVCVKTSASSNDGRLGKTGGAPSPRYAKTRPRYSRVGYVRR